MNDVAEAEQVAQEVWNLFGPLPGNTTNRPFGKAVIDGFDFDFESPVKNLVAFANHLRKSIDKANSLISPTDKKFILSGTPQCAIPDDNLGEVLDAAQFDLVMIQFYNNPCQALAFVRQATTSQNPYNFEAWSAWADSNTKAKPKLLIGLPADTGAATTGFLTIDELTAIVSNATTKYPNTFAGVMMWDMSRLMARIFRRRGCCTCEYHDSRFPSSLRFDLDEK